MLHVNFRREPALLWISLLAPLVEALTALLFVNNPALQGWINALAVAVAAAVTAVMVSAEDQVPLILGAIQALIALLVGLGLNWTPEQQGLVMVPIGIAIGILTRDRVVAPVPPIEPVPPAVA